LLAWGWGGWSGCGFPVGMMNLWLKPSDDGRETKLVLAGGPGKSESGTPRVRDLTGKQLAALADSFARVSGVPRVPLSQEVQIEDPFCSRARNFQQMPPHVSSTIVGASAMSKRSESFTLHWPLSYQFNAPAMRWHSLRIGEVSQRLCGIWSFSVYDSPLARNCQS